MSSQLGQIVGSLGATTRTNTLSPYDFAYWASTFIATGEPSDYNDLGPEVDGASLASWAASQIGVTFPSDYTSAAAALSATAITVTAALQIRGALIVAPTKIAVCLGFGDAIDIISGRYFIKRVSIIDITKWSYGATLPGAIY